jgi:hypothetical protein
MDEEVQLRLDIRRCGIKNAFFVFYRIADFRDVKCVWTKRAARTFEHKTFSSSQSSLNILRVILLEGSEGAEYTACKADAG